MSFLQTSVQSIIPKEQTIITVPQGATVGDTIKILSSHKILSAPLAQTSNTDRIVFIDMLAVLGGMFENIAELESNSPNDKREKLKLSGKFKEVIESKTSEFLQTKITECVDITKVKNFDVVTADQPFTRLLEIFKQGIHRVAVVDDETKSIRNIVSQSNVIQYLNAHIAEHSSKPMFQLTVKQILDSKQKNAHINKKQTVISVSQQDTAISALHRMHEHGVSAVGICMSSEEEGKNEEGSAVVGNFSASDLRGLSEDTLSSLYLPVMCFLEEQQQKEKTPGEEEDENSVKSTDPICVTPFDTLETVVSTLAEYKIHRVWVVNNKQQKHLLDVVTLTDVMQMLYEFQP